MERLEGKFPEREWSGLQASVVYTTDQVITPATMFCLYLHNRLGNLSPDFRVVPSLGIPSDQANSEFVSINGPQRKDDLLDLVDDVMHTEDLSDEDSQGHLLTRMAEYFGHTLIDQSTVTRYGKTPKCSLERLGVSSDLYGLLVSASLRHIDSPEESVQAGIQVFESLFQMKARGEVVDPFKISIPIFSSDILESVLTYKREMLKNIEQLITDGERIRYRLPVMHREVEGKRIRIGETRIDDYVALDRELERLRILEGSSVRMVIVGPPHSGKSTLTANLVAEISRQLEAVKGRFQYFDLRVECNFVDLDRSTPDTQAILQGRFDGNRAKTKWDNDLALSASQDFLALNSGIVLADAPGGDPDHITDVVAGPADIALILIGEPNDDSWQQIRDVWRQAVSGLGVLPIAQVRSRTRGDFDETTGSERQSTITSYTWLTKGDKSWIKQFGGRVVGLDRELLPNDDLIQGAASILLFDIFPQVVLERRRREITYLEMLQQDYADNKF